MGPFGQPPSRWIRDDMGETADDVALDPWRTGDLDRGSNARRFGLPKDAES